MHSRKRHIHAVVSKRARIFPVVGILGARQVGKSTFLMRQWQFGRARYVTLDKSEVTRRAKRAPENFLLVESEDLKRQLIIDEVQKVPALFDSMKSLLDERRRTGAFTVSGSVEFSDRAGVRESLGGRMGLCRLHPFTLAELGARPFVSPSVKGFKSGRKGQTTARDVEMWLQRGGMPVFCGFHDENERNLAIQGWLEAICYRDLLQLKGGTYSGDVALGLLKSIARTPRINQSKAAFGSGAGRASIAKHLSALKSLFLIHELPSLDSPEAASEYVLLDAAVLGHLLGDADEAFARTQAFRTLLVNEILAQHEYSGRGLPRLLHFRSRGGAEVDLVVEFGRRLLGIKICLSSDVSPYSLRGLKSFLAFHKGAEGVVLAPITERFTVDGIPVVPWTEIG